jgi:hypothetical protein
VGRFGRGGGEGPTRLRCGLVPEVESLLGVFSTREALLARRTASMTLPVELCDGRRGAGSCTSLPRWKMARRSSHGWPDMVVCCRRRRLNGWMDGWMDEGW